MVSHSTHPKQWTFELSKFDFRVPLRSEATEVDVDPGSRKQVHPHRVRDAILVYDKNVARTEAVADY